MEFVVAGAVRGSLESRGRKGRGSGLLLVRESRRDLRLGHTREQEGGRKKCEGLYAMRRCWGAAEETGG